jgi:hypothetical protein
MVYSPCKRIRYGPGESITIAINEDSSLDVWREHGHLVLDQHISKGHDAWPQWADVVSDEMEVLGRSCCHPHDPAACCWPPS